MTSLLNNALLQQNSQNKMAQPLPATKIDINTETKVQPLEAKGRLLKSRIIGSPIEYVKDLGKDVVSVKAGVQGKANDYQLGRMNDLAMKLGSLGIASYLFAKNPLQLKRSMEFVGFGTFFGGMALWPKLAIEAPLKLRTGVDIHQKYEDSYGRKKMFFQDPQYLPWDLVDQKQLDKLGDKMGIAKDVKDRNDLIKQKAQKIAVQGNTLWMLTAGFATPLISALSCSALEPVLSGAQQTKNLKDTAKEMEKLNGIYESNDAKQTDNAVKELVSKYENKAGKTALTNYLDAHASETLTDAHLGEIGKIVYGNSGDMLLKDAIIADLSEVSKPAETKNVIDSKFIKTFMDQNADEFAKHEIEPDNIKAFLENIGSEIDPKKFNKTMAEMLNVAAPDAGLTMASKKLLAQKLSKSMSNIFIENNKPTVGDISARATDLFSKLDEMFAHKKVVDKFIDVRVGDRAETFISHQWGKVNKTFLDVLGVDPKEIAKLQHNNPETSKMIDAKIKAVVGKDETYKTAISKLTEAIQEYDRNLTSQGYEGVAKSGLAKVYDRAGASLLDASSENGIYSNVAKHIVGTDDVTKIGGKALFGSLKYSSNSFVENRALGARACLYKMIQTLDLYRKIEKGVQYDGTLIDSLKGKFTDISPKALLARLNATSNEFSEDEAINKILKSDFAGLDVLQAQNKVEAFHQIKDATQDGGVAFHPGKRNWLNTCVEGFKNGQHSKEWMLEEISKQMKGNGNQAFYDGIAEDYKAAFSHYLDTLQKGEISPELRSLKSLLEQCSDLPDFGEKMTDETINKLHGGLAQKVASVLANESDVVKNKAKQAFMDYHITDFAEKLNDVGSASYQKVMNLMYGSDLDVATKNIIQETAPNSNLLNNIQEYKFRFMDKVGNWKAWVKPKHVVGKLTEGQNSTERHFLVGSSITDMISQTAEKTFNTKSWAKPFGIAFGVLVGVTLATELLFGKIKKEDLTAGGKQ